jgi:CRP-like cAMP-binding protein
LRNGLLDLLQEIGAPYPALSRFVLRSLNRCYRYLSQAKTLSEAASGKSIELLVEHLLEKKQETLEVTLRVLGVLEFQDRMPVILKAIHSGKRRDMDNAVEVLGSSLHGRIKKLLIPLLDGRPMDEVLALGRRIPDLGSGPTDSTEAILRELLEEDDAVTRTLCLYAIGERFKEGETRDSLSKWAGSDDPMIREAAASALNATASPNVAGREHHVDLVDKIIATRKVPLFSLVTLRDLVAVAQSATTIRCEKGETILLEGDPGDALYLILSGDFSVVKGLGTRLETILGRLGQYDFFGEMALLDRTSRSASVIAESEGVLLIVKAIQFEKNMKEHPAIALNICKVLSRRVREMQAILKTANSRRESSL